MILENRTVSIQIDDSHTFCNAHQFGLDFCFVLHHSNHSKRREFLFTEIPSPHNIERFAWRWSFSIPLCLCIFITVCLNYSFSFFFLSGRLTLHKMMLFTKFGRNSIYFVFVLYVFFFWTGYTHNNFESKQKKNND